jgi:hypothetical protein
MMHRPVVHNPDGSSSTLYSASFSLGPGKELLIPKISPDGRHLTDSEALEEFKRTGQHLGIYRTPQEADAAAEQYHNQQIIAALYGEFHPTMNVESDTGPLGAVRPGSLGALIEKKTP